MKIYLFENLKKKHKWFYLNLELTGKRWDNLTKATKRKSMASVREVSEESVYIFRVRILKIYIFGVNKIYRHFTTMVKYEGLRAINVDF